MFDKKLIQSTIVVMFIVALLLGRPMPAEAQIMGPTFTVKIEWGIKTPDRIQIGMQSAMSQTAQINYHYQSGTNLQYDWPVSQGSTPAVEIRHNEYDTIESIEILPTKGYIDSEWDRNGCVDGTSLELKDLGTEIQRILTNTSGQLIYYLETGVSYSEWKPLQAGELYNFTYSSRQGEIQVRTAENASSSFCGSFTWDFDEKPLPTDSYKFTITDTGILEGEAKYLQVLGTGLRGLRGLKGTIVVSSTLEIKGMYFGDTLTEAWNIGDPFITDPQHINFALGSGSPLVEDNGLLFYILVKAAAQYPEKGNVSFEKLEVDEERPYEVDPAIVQIGTRLAYGNVVDYYGNPLVNTKFTLEDRDFAYDGWVHNQSGKFLAELSENAPFTLTFTSTVEDSIGFVPIQVSLNCLTGALTCDTESMDTFDDGLQTIKDSICLIDFWLQRPRRDCETGTMQYDNPKTFDHFSPGLHNMKVTGRLTGKIIIIKVNTAMAAVQSQPTVEFISQRPALNGATVTLRISGQGGVGPVGLVLSHNLSGSSILDWYDNKIVVQNETVEITVPVTQTLQLAVHEIYYGTTVDIGTATIDLTPPTALFMPAVEND